MSDVPIEQALNIADPCALMFMIISELSKYIYHILIIFTNIHDQGNSRNISLQVLGLWLGFSALVISD